MDALITTIAGFLAEIQANYLVQTDKLRCAIEYTESSGHRTDQGLNKLEAQMRSLHQEYPTPTPKAASPAEAGPEPPAPHLLAPKPTRPPAVPLWSQVAGKKAKKPAPPPPAKAPHTAPPPLLPPRPRPRRRRSPIENAASSSKGTAPPSPPPQSPSETAFTLLSRPPLFNALSVGQTTTLHLSPWKR